MNILVIGNGFDLAHGLPTKYTDFLFFCGAVNSIINKNKIHEKVPQNYKNYIEWLNSDEKLSLNDFDYDKVKENGVYVFYLYKYNRLKYISDRDKKIYIDMLNNFIRDIFFKDNKNQFLIKEIIYLVHNNFWIDYFLHCDMHGKENWIDFESEISKVIKFIDNDMHNKKNKASSLDDDINILSSNYIIKTNEGYFYNKCSVKIYLCKTDNEITYRDIRNILYDDLNKLIRVFEIYLTEYVEKIDINDTLPEIQDIVAKLYEEHGEKGIIYSKVVNFNYTNTYEKLYLSKCNINITDHMDHIHGKADINSTIKTNNMVLGIDEFLEKKRRNKNIEFIAFKKYYQRIHKETGCKYKEWVEKIRERRKEEENKLREQFPKQIPINKFRSKHNLYIFGHSLDVTDKDILKELIINDNVKTTIFYLNKDMMGQQIANLVKVIGKNELLRRTSGKTKTIYFKQQISK